MTVTAMSPEIAFAAQQMAWEGSDAYQRMLRRIIDRSRV